LLGFIPVPEDSVTNCTFGGPELKSLYITAGTALWRIDLNERGWSRFLPAVRDGSCHDLLQNLKKRV
jgi:gluconolactonase